MNFRLKPILQLAFPWWLGSSLFINQTAIATTLPKQTVTPKQGVQFAQSSGICPAQLNGAIAPIINRVNARWGVLVQTQAAEPGSRKTLFSRNETTLLIPASNNKIFTTAAALSRLGQAYQIRTVVTGNSLQPDLETLRIIGRGDPSLTTAKLSSLVQQVKQKGIRQVKQLIGDDTYFRGEGINPYWDRDDTLTGYGAAVNSLMLNQNGVGFTLFPQRVGQPLRFQWDDPTDASQWRVDNQSVTVSAGAGEYVDAYRDPNQWIIRIDAQLRAGSAAEPAAVSIPNPGNYLVQKFRSALTTAQIGVTNSTLVRTTPALPGEVELAAIASPPLRDLLLETNRESNNIYAEALLKTLGATQTPNHTNATEAGTAAIKAALTSLGVNPGGFSQVDGSGLADRNRANVTALVQTLQAIARNPSDAQVFRNSLPLAGVNGTLKNRFRNTAAQGRLSAKTGYISGVVSLSGYLTPPNHPPVVLSIIVNQTGGNVATMRGAVDDIVLVLTRLRSC